MAVSAHEVERALLARLRPEYERKGYRFVAEPPERLLPPFLRGYRPDAIALKGDGGAIIEVTRRQGDQAVDELAAISKEVSSHSGWEFHVVFAGDDPNGDAVRFTPAKADVERELAAVQALIDAGHIRAALVMAWAAFEAVARAQPIDDDEAPKHRTPLQVVERLAMYGFLEPDTARRLRACAKLRNAVVHGDFSVDVTAEAVARLMSAIRDLAGDVASAAE